MEIQGCDPHSCNLVCTTCEWDECVVTADDGSGSLDVEIMSDSSICKRVAPRFLRLPKRAKLVP